MNELNFNFADLYKKIKSIDETVQADVQAIGAAPSQPELPDDGHAQLECGDDKMPPKASGPGMAGDDELLIGEKGMEECGNDMQGGPQVSVRSLIAALQAIEQGSHSGHEHGDEVAVFGMDEVSDGGFGDATTEPDPEVDSVDCMTKTGGDLHSNDIEALKVNGGGNPMREALISKLSAHYQSIKEGEKKTMSRAAKGVMKYGKDGMQALAKAGKDGKNLDKVRDKYNKYD